MSKGTNYRVDVATSPVTPVGMNSIRYLGNSWSSAKKAFEHTETGKNAWNQPNPAYGVILSVWDETNSRYVVKMQKGF